MARIDAAVDGPALSRLYAGAESLLGIGAWECDLATERLTWTPGVYRLFDLSPGEGLDRKRVVDLYEEASRASMERLRAEALRTGVGFSLDAEIVSAAGNRRWIRLDADVALENGRPSRLFGGKRDITRERLQWERLRLKAERDGLTGLANRDVFERRLASALDAPVALVIVDIDHFKPINDRFGHAAGDAVLQEAARRLSIAFRDAIVVARIGGDEFAVLLGAPIDRAGLEQSLSCAVGALKRPAASAQCLIPFSASIGAAVADVNERPTRDGLFAAADAALYAAKMSGRGAFRIAGSKEADVERHWA